jgi:hypothetical protein
VRLHYFVKRVNGRFQAQESQASYGGEHDHPVEIVGGKVVTHGTFVAAAAAARKAYNEVREDATAEGWRVTINTKEAK